MPLTKNGDFTLDGYADMIAEFATAGYSFTRYQDAVNDVVTPPYVILRHDLDFSIEAALVMARLEHGLHVHSTYFFQLRSPLYNPLSKRVVNAGLRIYQLGHDLALHFDLSLYQSGFDQCIIDELDVLRRYYPFANGNIISFHRPGSLAFDLHTLSMPDGVIHTYSKAFFHDIAYFSDGAGIWRSGHPLSSEAFLQRKPMQILTHPMRWVVQGNNDLEKLRCLLNLDRTNRIQMFEETAVSISLAGLH